MNVNYFEIAFLMFDKSYTGKDKSVVEKICIRLTRRSAPKDKSSLAYFWSYEKAGKVFNDAMTSNSTVSSVAVVNYGIFKIS